MVTPSDFRQRSFLARKLSAAGATFGTVGDSAVALDFPDAPAGGVGLTDLSPLPRCGFKGAGTADWVSGQGADLPPAPNLAARQMGGALIARLAPEEVLILSALDDEAPGLVQELSQAWTGETRSGYPVPRQDSHAWLYVAGRGRRRPLREALRGRPQAPQVRRASGRPDLGRPALGDRDPRRPGRQARLPPLGRQRVGALPLGLPPGRHGRVRRRAGRLDGPARRIKTPI